MIDQACITYGIELTECFFFRDEGCMFRWYNGHRLGMRTQWAAFVFQSDTSHPLTRENLRGSYEWFLSPNCGLNLRIFPLRNMNIRTLISILKYKNTDENEWKFFCFKAKKWRPPTVEELILFKRDMLSMLDKIKFKNVENGFQKRLANKIRKSSKIFVQGDKTCNMYTIDRKKHKMRITDEVNILYKKKINTGTLSK